MGQRLAGNFPGTALAALTTASLTAVFSEVYKTCRALQRLKLLINQESDDSCQLCRPTVARWRSFTQHRTRPARGSCVAATGRRPPLESCGRRQHPPD